MLQVYVYGTVFKGFLDLVPGTNLDIQTLADVFDEELTLGEYSLPLDAPWTDNNKKILGNIEMLSSVPGNEITSWQCNVWADGITVRTNATLTLTDNNGSFNYDAGTFSFTIAGYKGLFGSLVANKTLRDLTLDSISTHGLPARMFATYVMKGELGFTQHPYMKFAPCAIMNFFDTNRPDYNNEFLTEDIVNNIVVTGTGIDDWEFGRPSAANTSVSALQGTAEYLDYRTVPFFTYKWIIQKIFDEFGYTIAGDYINDPAWDKAFMYNNFGIEQYDRTANTDVCRTIYPAQHMPSKLIGTFLRDLQFLFCAKFTFLANNIVRMDYRKSDLQSKKVVDATNYCGRLFTNPMLDFKTKGFKLSYNFDSADSYNGARVQSIDDKQLVATVNKFTDLGSLIIGRAFQFNDLVFVKAENQYYAYSNGVGTGAWEYYSEKLFPYTIGDGGYDYETGISPMVTYLLYDNNIDKLVNKDMVGADMKGSYYNKNNTLVTAPFDTRIFFIDMIEKAGVKVPSSFVNNRDRANNVRVPVSLAWDGDDGLYTTLWADWLTFLMNSRSVSVPMYFDEKSYADFLSAVKVRIAGTLYLPHQVSVTLPLNNAAASIELYRL